jgi:hypothetical protein
VGKRARGELFYVSADAVANVGGRKLLSVELCGDNASCAVDRCRGDVVAGGEVPGPRSCFARGVGAGAAGDSRERCEALGEHADARVDRWVWEGKDMTEPA